MATDASAPPSDLDALGRKLYFKLREHLRKQSMFEDSDRYVLGQVCRYEQRARLARKGLDELVALGYKGQTVQHPNLKTAETAERAFMDGLKELGLTPAARKRLDVQVRKAGGKFDFS